MNAYDLAREAVDRHYADEGASERFLAAQAEALTAALVKAAAEWFMDQDDQN